MTSIRPISAADLDALYAIALATGDNGQDASSLHSDGHMIGHLYSAPYAVLSPETGFIADDVEGVAGYIVGAYETRAFEDRLERDWWPALRLRYADPVGDPASWNADQRRAHMIHHPSRAPEVLTVRWPAHVHMNLLPRLQGQGVGAALLRRWLDTARQASIPGVHLGTSLGNKSAQGFWQSQGFRRLTDDGLPEGACWFGMEL